MAAMAGSAISARSAVSMARLVHGLVMVDSIAIQCASQGKVGKAAINQFRDFG
jgi:hypothetical protein